MNYRKNCNHYMNATRIIRGIDHPEIEVIGGPGCRRQMMIAVIGCKPDCEGFVTYF
jgi:hypothetical protein